MCRAVEALQYFLLNFFITYKSYGCRFLLWFGWFLFTVVFFIVK